MPDQSFSTGGNIDTGSNTDKSIDHRHYQQIAAAIRFICQAYQQGEIPDLGTIAAVMGMSEYHFQRLFSRWAGVSPKRFQQYLTKEYARRVLQESRSVLEVALASGLSGSGRLHDLMVQCEAVTPGEIKRAGAGLQITHGCAVSPFGAVHLGWTARGICHLSFYDSFYDSSYDSLYDSNSEGLLTQIQQLQQDWPKARLIRDDQAAAQQTALIFADRDLANPPLRPLHLLLRGTNFQLKVWEALLQVSAGERVGYADLARLAGSPGAARAVGTALAANRIGYLIPCHRVIRDTGVIGQYRWGTERKTLMLGWEACQHEGFSDDSMT